MESWNQENPKLEKFGAIDRAIMSYFHFCIPERLHPDDLGADALLIQDRFILILDPILSNPRNELSEKSYSEIVADKNNLNTFLKRLTAARSENPEVTPYFIPGTKVNFVHLFHAGYIPPGSTVRLRVGKQDYDASVLRNGRLEFIINDSRNVFESPAVFAAKGLAHKGFNPWRFTWVIEDDGRLMQLDDYRVRFKKEKPLKSHFDSGDAQLPSSVKSQKLISSRDDDFYEGSIQRISVEVRERNSAARNACIAHHKCNCAICGFNFGTIFGAAAKGFIHVHHIKPLSKSMAEGPVDPEKDLIPLCPNCHSVVHLRKEPYSVEDVREMITQQIKG